jgi:pimeloyl-ACP methyl ester carboxylesterase
MQWQKLWQGWGLATLVVLLALPLAPPAAASATAPLTHACRVPGIPNELQCGVVQRPLDPQQPEGTQIDVHFMVVAALARNKLSDAVLLLAGGPGQSAMAIAPMVIPRLTRLNNRRDLVFVDQRGTGKSALLQCPDESRLPAGQALNQALQLERLQHCAQALGKLPHGDLRFYTTTLAMQDVEAVRIQLGVSQWNLIGASYGTRAALEYLRQYPNQVRRTVLDGVAPPDMVLPTSFSTDGQAAFDQLLAACEQDTVGERACAVQFPQLRREWAQLLHSLPRAVSVSHPVTGVAETFTLTRDALLRSVRVPLYAPFLAAGLPQAIHSAARGNFVGLVGLSGALGNNKAMRLATGMHFSVICAEDVPRMSIDAAPMGRDFGSADADFYTRVCSFWPRGAVPVAFYAVPPSRSPVLLLSGGADPATPARHGARVAKALGEKAQHIVIPQAGHGVMGLGCMRDVVYRFVNAADDAQAVTQDASCALKTPRPGVFLPIRTGEAQP